MPVERIFTVVQKDKAVQFSADIWKSLSWNCIVLTDNQLKLTINHVLCPFLCCTSNILMKWINTLFEYQWTVMTTAGWKDVEINQLHFPDVVFLLRKLNFRQKLNSHLFLPTHSAWKTSKIQPKTSIWMTNVYIDLYIVSSRLLLALEFLCTTINPRPWTDLC